MATRFFLVCKAKKMCLQLGKWVSFGDDFRQDGFEQVNSELADGAWSREEGARLLEHFIARTAGHELTLLGDNGFLELVEDDFDSWTNIHTLEQLQRDGEIKEIPLL